MSKRAVGPASRALPPRRSATLLTVRAARASRRGRVATSRRASATLRASGAGAAGSGARPSPNRAESCTSAYPLTVTPLRYTTKSAPRSGQPPPGARVASTITFTPARWARSRVRASGSNSHAARAVARSPCRSATARPASAKALRFRFSRPSTRSVPGPSRAAICRARAASPENSRPQSASSSAARACASCRSGSPRSACSCTSLASGRRERDSVMTLICRTYGQTAEHLSHFLRTVK